MLGRVRFRRGIYLALGGLGIVATVLGVVGLVTAPGGWSGVVFLFSGFAWMVVAVPLLVIAFAHFLFEQARQTRATAPPSSPE
jgi:hypothetical protein